MRASALIADREQASRERLVALLHEVNGFDAAHQCENGCVAVEQIRTSRPDLVFLDADLPGMDGFDVLEAVLDVPPTAVVIITDDDPSMRQALEVSRVDHLVRPIDEDAFRVVMRQVRIDLEGGRNAIQARLQSLLEAVGRRRSYTDRLVVKDNRQIVILGVDEIDWVESAGNYVRLHVGEEVHQMRSTLSALEGRLDPDLFLRIHRSIIVNVDRVKQITPWFHGDSAVILRDGTRLNLSRSYRANVDRFLERYSD
jgi:two-component system LytT family response regulator